jgi:hypothetical protein
MAAIQIFRGLPGSDNDFQQGIVWAGFPIKVITGIIGLIKLRAPLFIRFFSSPPNGNNGQQSTTGTRQDRHMPFPKGDFGIRPDIGIF